MRGHVGVGRIAGAVWGRGRLVGVVGWRGRVCPLLWRQALAAASRGHTGGQEVGLGGGSSSGGSSGSGGGG